MAVVIAAPLSQQLQPKFIGLRTLFEARERPSRMYSWVTLVFANVLVEVRILPYHLRHNQKLTLWTVADPVEPLRRVSATFRARSGCQF